MSTVNIVASVWSIPTIRVYHIDGEPITRVFFKGVVAYRPRTKGDITTKRPVRIGVKAFGWSAAKLARGEIQKGDIVMGDGELDTHWSYVEKFDPSKPHKKRKGVYEVVVNLQRASLIKRQSIQQTLEDGARIDEFRKALKEIDPEARHIIPYEMLDDLLSHNGGHGNPGKHKKYHDPDGDAGDASDGAGLDVHE